MEGFEEIATVDRLLGELDTAASGRRSGRTARTSRDGLDAPVLDARTVLVVDEAGMLGSANSPGCSTTPRPPTPRSSWSATTGSSPRSESAMASVVCSATRPASRCR